MTRLRAVTTAGFAVVIHLKRPEVCPYDSVENLCDSVQIWVAQCLKQLPEPWRELESVPNDWMGVSGLRLTAHSVHLGDRQN